MKKRIEMQIQTDLTLEAGIEKWMNYCKRRGLTENTLRYYQDITNIFLKHVHYKTDLSTINKDTIDNFITELQKEDIKTTTINSYLNAMRSICNWWASEGYFLPFKIEKIKCDEEIKETFSSEDIKKLLMKPNVKKCSFLEYECWVLCNTFYALGARASTIVNLTIADLDLNNGYITYRKVKDRKQTIIPLPSALIPILEEYLTYRDGADNDYLFVHSYSGKLSVDRLNHILNSYYISRKVSKTGIHIWRRTYAKDYIVAGGSALKLQATLCHKTLDMTKKYVSLYGKDIRDDDHNPLQRISNTGHMKMNRGGRK